MQDPPETQKMMMPQRRRPVSSGSLGLNPHLVAIVKLLARSCATRDYNALIQKKNEVHPDD